MEPRKKIHSRLEDAISQIYTKKKKTRSQREISKWVETLKYIVGNLAQKVRHAGPLLLRKTLNSSNAARKQDNFIRIYETADL